MKNIFVIFPFLLLTISCGSLGINSAGSNFEITPQINENDYSDLTDILGNYHGEAIDRSPHFLITIKHDFSFEKQEYYQRNIFSLFPHKVIYDSYYRDFNFPNSEERIVESKYSELSLVERNNFDNNETYKRLFFVQLESDDYKKAKAILDLIKNHESIYRIEANHLNKDINDSTSSSLSYLSGSLWGLTKINASAAWNYTHGSSNIKIGIIDSGIQGTHPSLSNNIDFSLSKSFVTGDFDSYGIIPTNSHGTEVAGIIGAYASSGLNVQGVANQCKLVSLKININGYANVTALINAIDYARQKNIPILTFSNNYFLSQIGSLSSDLVSAINNYPGIIVCSAGNESINIHNPGLANNLDPDVYFKRYLPMYNFPRNKVIVVTGISQATDSNNKNLCIYNFSNQVVDIAAPGEGCLTTTLNSSSCSANGSSIAAPFVSGSIALFMSYFPCLSKQDIINYIFNSSAMSQMSQCAVLVNAGYDLGNYPSIQPYSIVETETNGILNLGASFNLAISHLTYTSLNNYTHSISCSHNYNYGTENHNYVQIRSDYDIDDPNSFPTYECTKCHHRTHSLPSFDKGDNDL